MSASDKDNDDYHVGYGKPPKESQFKKGQSGNLRGRSKGSKNWSTLLTNALDEVISIKEGGQSKLVTVRKAIHKRLINNALSGSLRAIQVVLQEDEKLEKKRLDQFGTDAELERERKMEIVRAMTKEERQQYLEFIKTVEQRIQLRKEANSCNVKASS
jgi:hypothetical protein